MSTIVTRSGKGSPLTHVEVDANFTNLNTDKYQEGSAIGSTTPAAGTFTTLTATGQTSLGGAVGSESLRVYTPSATGTWLSVKSTAAVANIGTEGTSLPFVVNTNSGIFSVRSSSFGGVSEEQFRVTRTASAVNYVQVTGAATGSGNYTTISSQGSDASVNLRLSAKGTSTLDAQVNSTTRWKINSDGSVDSGLSASGGISFKASATGSQVNYLQSAGGVAGSAPILSTQGTDTNIPLVLQPKGTGALQAQQTDSTATGGNARGANAVDWQTTRGAASQVASSTNSIIGGGFGNTASAFNTTIAGGASNSTQGNYNFVGGGQSNLANGAFFQTYSSIVGGRSNTANGFFNFIGGGFTNSGTTITAVTTQSATMNGTTAVTLSGSNANIKVGQFITGTSIADGTYVSAISGTSLTLSQAASGSSTSTLSFFTPHGVVVGGGNNQATGSYSFIGGGGDAGTAGNRNVASGDWSTVAGGQKNTASGAGSFIGGGGTFGGGILANTASGAASSVVGGVGNTASGFISFSGGGSNNTANGLGSVIAGGNAGTARSISGNAVFPACDTPISGTAGSTQASLLVLGVQTTDATATVLRSNTAAAGTTNQVILPNNSAYYFRGTVVAGVTGGGNTSSWSFEGTIKRGANAASTALVGTPVLNLIGQDSGASAWVVALTADTTNGGLAVTVTGQASTTIRWVAKIETTEMTY